MNHIETLTDYELMRRYRDSEDPVIKEFAARLQDAHTDIAYLEERVAEASGATCL